MNSLKNPHQVSNEVSSLSPQPLWTCGCVIKMALSRQHDTAECAESLMAAVLHTDHIGKGRAREKEIGRGEREREVCGRCGGLRQHVCYQSPAFLHSGDAGPFRGHAKHNGFSVTRSINAPRVLGHGEKAPCVLHQRNSRAWRCHL